MKKQPIQCTFLALRQLAFLLSAGHSSVFIWEVWGACRLILQPVWAGHRMFWHFCSGHLDMLRAASFESVSEGSDFQERTFCKGWVTDGGHSAGSMGDSKKPTSQPNKQKTPRELLFQTEVKCSYRSPWTGESHLPPWLRVCLLPGDQSDCFYWNRKWDRWRISVSTPISWGARSCQERSCRLFPEQIVQHFSQTMGFLCVTHACCTEREHWDLGIKPG